MSYNFSNLKTDIKNYTEVDSSVLSDSVLTTIVKNAENRIYRESDADDNRFYATSSLQSGNRYVTIPSDLRVIRYVQLTDSSGNQVFLEKRDKNGDFYHTIGGICPLCIYREAKLQPFTADYLRTQEKE